MANLRRLAFDLIDHAKLAEKIAVEDHGLDIDQPPLHQNPLREENLLDVAKDMRRIACLLVGYFPVSRSDLPEYTFDGASSWEEAQVSSDSEEAEPPPRWW